LLLVGMVGWRGVVVSGVFFGGGGGGGGGTIPLRLNGSCASALGNRKHL